MATSMLFYFVDYGIAKKWTGVIIYLLKRIFHLISMMIRTLLSVYREYCS